VLLAIVLTFGTLVGFALGRSSAPDHPVHTTRPLSATGGPWFVPAGGWNTAQTGDVAPPQGAAAMAATVKLLDPPGSLPHKTLAELGPDDVLVTVILYSPADFMRGPGLAPGRAGYPRRTLPLRVEQGLFDSGFEGVPQYWRYAIQGRVAGWMLEVDVWVGSAHPSAAVRRLADAQLRRLVLPSTCPDADPLPAADLHGAGVIAGRMVPRGRNLRVKLPLDLRDPTITVHRATDADLVPARCREVPRARIAVVDVRYPHVAAGSPWKRRTFLVSRQRGRYVVWSRRR
jgi:hypothetical protein